MSSADGANFGDKVVLDKTSFTGPALAVHRGSLCLAWASVGNRQINYHCFSQFPGQSHPKVTLDETSIATPALAGVRLAWTGTDPDHHLNVAARG